MHLRIPVLVASLLLSSSALADEVCVVIDEKADTLTETDRRGALAVARAAFVKAGETLVDAPCANTYTLTNSRLGETIFVTLSGPKGQRDAKAIKVDELGDLYQQMAVSLIKGVPMDEAVTRNNVTSRQEQRRRIKAESVYFFSLGPAYLLSVDPSSIPLHLGGGYRYELDSFGLEVNFGLAFATNDDNDDNELSLNSQLGIAGYWFADGEANNTPYFGVGLGYGGGLLAEQDATFSGAGLQGTISAGYEMLRASTIRAFVQFDAILPFYTMSQDTLFSDGVERDDRYGPVFLLKVAIGWAPRMSSVSMW